MAGTAPFTVARTAWGQPAGRPAERPAVVDLREAPQRSWADRAAAVSPEPTRASQLEVALAALCEHWWVVDYANDAPNRHRDAPDTAALVEQIQRDFADQPGVRVHWTGQDLLVEAGRWRTRPLACFTPLNVAYHPAATLLATLAAPPAYPARDAMDFDVPVSRAAVALLAAAQGDPTRLLPGAVGPISGAQLLSAVQRCFLTLPAERWQQLCDQAPTWQGELADLVAAVSGTRSAVGGLPTF